MTRRLDISIGPVQGFVAQSRRTRDLWGSSYLLAFLAAHAMRGANTAGGDIIQPVVGNDPLYRWVCGHRDGVAPRVGSLPNHFVVNVDSDPSAVASAAIESFKDAWRRVCDAVWRRFVEHPSVIGNGTAQIWGRQVDTFWEMTWTAGEADAGGGWLARRKHWRSHCPPDEPGDKCAVMHDLQELSGHVRSESGAGRREQDRFWCRVRRGMGPLDLRDHERLCAIALVKRLFPKVAREALGWHVETSHWPSTAYVGAVPWIARAAGAAPRQARAYADAVGRNATGVFHEQQPEFEFDGVDVSVAGAFAKLDANYFHREFVASARRCPLNENVADDARKQLGCKLKAIYDAKDAAGRQLGAPSSFYALLLADGDHLGRLVGKSGGQVVSKALADFTREVPNVVRQSNGVTVYAGGDDVLAMLPVSKALPCAEKLAACYRTAFPDGNGATLSAAVTFAHVRLPLAGVIAEAHRLLDDVAKDGNGRDSLAAAVLKPSGLYCEWTTTWRRRLPGGESTPALTSLNGLVDQIRRNTTEPGLSSALIYRIRETLALLCGWSRWRPGEWRALPVELDVRAFLHAEVLQSLSVRTDEGAEESAGELTDSIWPLLGPARAPAENSRPAGDGTAADDTGACAAEAGVDALLLARFLADPDEDVR